MINILAVSINDPWVIALIVIGGFLVASGIAMFFIAPHVIFINTMYRNPKKKRTRECTNKSDESQMRMFNEGTKWAEQYKDKTEKLHMVHEGLNLYGEYINFGYDKCAVILQGRTESLLYSYYFADVYAKNGYNILTIDVRGHGLSDGKYLTLGIDESRDLVQWIKLINQKYGIDDFALHGICTGAATSVYAYIQLKNEGKDFIKKIVTDGLFITGFELFKMHFKFHKKKAFPFLYMVFWFAFLRARVRLFTETPLKYIDQIDIPILFIWSAKDLFCIQSKAEELFEACKSPYKQIQFFPDGRHSHVRATQEKEYDEAIDEFLKYSCN